MTRWIPALTFAATFALSGAASAAAFVAGTDVCLDNSCNDWAASYSGAGITGEARGTVLDGGSDAFDGAGYLYFDATKITVARRTETFVGLNTYRWFDTFTNITGTQITTSVRFYSNLGSDGSELVSYDDAHLTVTREDRGGSSYDPVLALVNGNNAYAAFMNVAVTSNSYNSEFELTLEDGQSVSVVHFAHLARPDDDYINCSTSASGGLLCFGNSSYDAVASGTVAAATATGLSLVSSPYFNGLSAAEISGIINFDANGTVPEPGSLALVGLALAGAAGALRRKAR